MYVCVCDQWEWLPAQLDRPVNCWCGLAGWEEGSTAPNTRIKLPGWYVINRIWCGNKYYGELIGNTAIKQKHQMAEYFVLWSAAHYK